MPISVGFASALSSYIDYSGLKVRRSVMNENITKLTNLMTWWDGLTIVEKRTLSSRNYAVELVEDCVLNLAEKYTGVSPISMDSMDGGPAENDGQSKEEFSQAKKERKEE